MKNDKRKARLILADGKEFSGEMFGKLSGAEGEVVFTTGMMGYVETLTDPSFQGQILVMTYPMIGNYGIPQEKADAFGILEHFESDAIHVRGLIVNEHSRSFSHWRGVKSISDWLEEKGIPGLSGVDTRALTEYLRENGSQKGQIVVEGAEMKPFSKIIDPNTMNLAGEVSCKKLMKYSQKNGTGKTIVLYDFGVKFNILRSFLKRGVNVIRLPWDYPLEDLKEKYDGVFVSNGPGDPMMVKEESSRNILHALKKGIPFFGICLGNQLLALAVGGKTEKLKYGHRGVNQPCREVDTGKCVVTSQNHGYVVDVKSLPEGWELWWENLNDGTCEGIRHKKKTAFSIQFHPEACPGPQDSEYLFDLFLSKIS